MLHLAFLDLMNGPRAKETPELVEMWQPDARRDFRTLYTIWTNAMFGRARWARNVRGTWTSSPAEKVEEAVRDVFECWHADSDWYKTVSGLAESAGWLTLIQLQAGARRAESSDRHRRPVLRGQDSYDCLSLRSWV